MTNFFISYNSADEAIATQIAQALVDAGYSVRYAFWEIGLGDDIPQWMSDALDDCERMIGVASPDWTKPDAKYSGLERAAMLWTDVEGRRGAIIPVVVRPCTLPVIIGGRARHDLTRESLDDLIRKLKAHPRNWPPRNPPADGKPATVLVGLPPLTNTVHGRAAEVAALRKALTEAGEAAVVNGVVVPGQGGLGKSTLARQYAEVWRSMYDGIFWGNAGNEASLSADLLGLGMRLGLAVDAGAPRQSAELVVAKLSESGQSWLCVYDNAEDLHGIRELQPQGAKVHLIVTTREWQGWKGAGFRLVETGVLPFATEDGAAVTVLMEAANRTEDRAGARSLAEALGGLPLALVVAGALVREEGGSFADWTARIGEVMTAPGEGGYRDSVLAAVRLSHDRLSPDAKLVAGLFAWWAAEGLDARLITDAPGGEWWDQFKYDIPSEVQALAQVPGRVSDAMRELRRRSLTTATNDMRSMHRLTARALRDLDTAPETTARAAASLIAAVVPGGAGMGVNNPASWPQCRRLTPHVTALLDSGRAPETAAMDTLLNQAAIWLDRMGEFGLQLRFAEEALRIAEQRLPEEHRDIAVGLANLGTARASVGDPVGAVAELERAVALDEEHRPSSPELANHCDLLGGALLALAETGDAAAAIRGLRRRQQALALRRRRLPRRHEEIGLSLANLAYIRLRLGQRQAAHRLQTIALTIHRAALPPGDARLGATCANLGGLMLGGGKPGGWRESATAALPLLTEALEIFEAAFPDRPGHLDRRDTADWLIACHLVLARPPGNTGLHMAQVQTLCTRYSVDFDARKAEVDRLYPA